MLNRILFVVIVMALGWFFREYFSVFTQEINTPKTVQTVLEVSKPINVIAKIERDKWDGIDTTIIDEHSEITLGMLLAQNRFYDALAFYLDANSDNTEVYMQQIETYLATLAKTNAGGALEFMQVFLDNVPESKILKVMIKTSIVEGNFHKAIELIMQAKENYVSEIEDKRLLTQLKTVAMQHIDVLMARKEYALLISFLEEMIAYDSLDGFYTFRLAELFMHLDKTYEATALLNELQYDEIYAQSVESMLNTIEKKDSKSEYKYAIPLKKYGNHFVAKVYLDGHAFNLMLDTGATYIFIDEDKASGLKVLNHNLILRTAGNEISAKLCQVSVLEVDNIKIQNIKVTVAPFKRNGIDGLLGMNFFKYFRFFINQDEGVLYLDPKN